MDINASELELLFDAVPDVLFFVKDRERRYTHANLTIVHRLGLSARSDVIGKRADDVYPGGLSAAYARQDLLVLAGETIDNLLELQLFPNCEPGWCLTSKRPLLENGKTVGLIGISRDLDLGQSDRRGSTYERISAALAYLNQHYDENVRMCTLMQITGFSLSKLERAFQKIFQMTPQQVLTKLRVQMAMHHLKDASTIASVSLACGFTDHSAFTRQFKTIVGISPREYRTLLQHVGPNLPLHRGALPGSTSVRASASRRRTGISGFPVEPTSSTRDSQTSAASPAMPDPLMTDQPAFATTGTSRFRKNLP